MPKTGESNSKRNIRMFSSPHPEGGFRRGTLSTHGGTVQPGMFFGTNQQVKPGMKRVRMLVKPPLNSKGPASRKAKKSR